MEHSKNSNTVVFFGKWSAVMQNRTGLKHSKYIYYGSLKTINVKSKIDEVKTAKKCPINPYFFKRFEAVEIV